MSIDDALQFLREHQPLPPTDEIPDALLRRFNEVREFFVANPDPRCVALLLNSFGEGDGHGVYQLVEDVIRAFPDEVVVTALVASLRNAVGSVRYWSAEIAAIRPSPDLVEPLIELLNHGNLDERLAAVAALEVLGTPKARIAMERALITDDHDDVKSWIREALDK